MPIHTTSILATVGILAVGAACATPDSEAPEPGTAVAGEPEVDPREQPTGLTVTRADGSTFTLDDLQVTCGKGQNVQDVESLFIVGYPPERQGLTFFLLEAVLADITDGATIALPADDEPQRRFILFVNDPSTDNELSSAQEESSGEVVVDSATCDPKPTATIHVDATLGSEVSELPTADVEGTIVLTGSEPPVTEP